MYKHLVSFLLLVAIFWMVVACSASQIDQAEQQWTGQNITDYHIEVLVVESIWHAQTHQIMVQNNAVVEATASCIPAPMEAGECEVRAFTAEEYTIPGLFAQVRVHLKSQQAQWIEITYEPTYGFPSQITFDNPNLVDEDWTWRVTSFETLP